MLKLRMPAYKSSLIALFISALIALLVWKMPLKFISQAVLEGSAMGIWPILWVVFAAIFTYNLSVKSGSMEKIKTMLLNISPDRRIQALIMAFAFGGFLEASAGFGTAVAIPAGILAALGFEPLFAAVICLVANTIPVAFGGAGLPIITLSNLTELPLHTLTAYVALQLLPFVIVLPAFIVVLTTGSIRGLKGVIGITVASGAAFGIGQTLVAVFIGPELAAIVGSLLSLLTLVLWSRVSPIKTPWKFKNEKSQIAIKNELIGIREGIVAWIPYIFILVFILITRLPFMSFLNIELKFHIYWGPGGKPMAFPLVTSPGTIILISALLGAVILRLHYKIIFAVAWSTVKQIWKTIVTVLSIVSLAKVLDFSGMISSIAYGLSSITGSFFPLFSPLIGALGTFITGSDTSANVLFGELQKQTALQIHANPGWITAANASGATAGKMISPQSIAIAATATGLTGSEGKMLGKTIKYSLAFAMLLGIIVYVANYALGGK